MLKKLFALAAAALLAAAITAQVSALPSTGALTVTGKEKGVDIYQEDDFEDYNEGVICSATADQATILSDSVKNSKGVSITNIWNFRNNNKSESTISLETVTDRNGNAAKAIQMSIAEANTNTAVAFWPKISLNRGKRYYVVKAWIKNGTSADDAYNGLCFHSSMYIRRTTASNSAQTLTSPIKAYDWNEYMFVADTQTGNMQMVVNGEITEIEVSNNSYKDFNYLKTLAFNAWYDSARTKTAWFDSVAVYGVDSFDTALASSLPKDGERSAARSDEIRLDFSGAPLDQESLEAITVSAGGVPVSIESVSCENGSCTIRLTEKMAEFTQYEVDYSGVRSCFGIEVGGKSLRFTTTGRVRLAQESAFTKVNAVESSEIEKLENGLIEAELTVSNPTDQDLAEVTLIAALTKNGAVEAMCYDVAHMDAGASASMKAAFTVSEPEGYCVETYVKDSLNGGYYYTDAAMLDAAGIRTEKRGDREESWPTLAALAQTANSVTFHRLKLGENGSREGISAIESGLVECRTAIPAAGRKAPYVIAALKKDGRLVKTVYLTKESVADFSNSGVALTIPEEEGYTLDVFAWEDFDGTIGRFGKTSLS